MQIIMFHQTQSPSDKVQFQVNLHQKERHVTAVVSALGNKVLKFIQINICTFNFTFSLGFTCLFSPSQLSSSCPTFILSFHFHIHLWSVLLTDLSYNPFSVRLPKVQMCVFKSNNLKIVNVIVPFPKLKPSCPKLVFSLPPWFPLVLGASFVTQ